MGTAEFPAKRVNQRFQSGRGLRSWETWGAELLESHLSYPMLAYYRSQHENQSWLGVLAVIMDTCALLLVGRHAASPIQARMTFMRFCCKFVVPDWIG